MNKKSYVYISIICVLSLVFCCFTAGAASITPSIAGPQVFYCQLINQYTVDYEMDSTDTIYPYGNYNVYVYQGSFTVNAGSLSVDSYINGVSTGVVTCTPNTPSGCSLGSCNYVFNPVTSDHLYSGCWLGSSTSGNIRVIYDNFYTGNSTVVGVGTVTFTCSFYSTATPSNVPDPPVSVSVSVSNSSSANCTANPNPSDEGLVALIRDGIINALADVNSPFEDLLTYIQNTNAILSDIYNHNEQWYSAIVDELLANNQWNSTITDELIALYSELSINTNATINIASYTADLRTFMQTFPTWSSQVLTLLGKLADMNAAQHSEAAAIESQYDNLQQQQDNANAVVSAVPRPTFSAGQFDGDNLVNSTQRQNFTGFLSLIVGNSYITTIFLIIITFATAGFVLFGKKR